jgi:hypothetical protein
LENLDEVTGKEGDVFSSVQAVTRSWDGRVKDEGGCGWGRGHGLMGRLCETCCYESNRAYEYTGIAQFCVLVSKADEVA